jgi:hypothetical protein
MKGTVAVFAGEDSGTSLMAARSCCAVSFLNETVDGCLICAPRSEIDSVASLDFMKFSLAKAALD